MNSSPCTPPRKKPGQGLGPRRVNGAVMDVTAAAGFIGTTEKTIRGQVSRRLIPFRRLGGRIVFVRQEIEAWLASLEGCRLDEALANMKERDALV
jgi:hypothetical protein